MKPLIQIVVCQNTKSTDGITIIENPYSLVSFPDMPTSASFKLAIVVGRLDFKESNEMRLTMYPADDPSEVVFDSGTNVIGPLTPPNDIVTILENLNLDFSVNNARIKREGEYVFSFEFGNEIITQNIQINHHPID